MAWWNINEWLASSDPKWDPDKITCEIDGEPVDIKECEGAPVGIGTTHLIDPRGISPKAQEILNQFPIDYRLSEKGYKYDEEKDWWARTWSTNEGRETIVEAYKCDNDRWKSIMIGYGDRIFYEEEVSEPT